MTTGRRGPDDGRLRALGPVLTLLALTVLAVGLAPALESGPWRRSWLGHNGARYAQIARNYLRDGLVAGGAPRMDTEGADPAAPQVYGHHPPGVSLVVAAVFAVTGVGETPARLVAVLASALALLLLALLVARVAGVWVGGLAALVAACMPMTWVYGAHLDVQGTPVLAASLAVLWTYARWVDGASVLPLVLAALLASALDWYGLYAPAGCALHLLLTRPRRWRAALGLGALTGLLFAFWMGWLAHLPGMSWERLRTAASVRGLSNLGQWGDDASRQLDVWWSHSLRLMPVWPLLVLLGLGLAAVGRGAPSARGALGSRGLILLLLLPPLAHALLFPAGMLVHSYWLFGLPVALGAVVALACARLRGGLWLGLAACAALGLTEWRAAAPALPDPPDALPALLGQQLASHTAAGELILTNYNANPLVAGSGGDHHITRRPEITYYSDRPVRGLPGAADLSSPPPEALEQALERLPQARWVLLVPWPPASEALVAAVSERAAGPPLVLSQDPLVRLYRLAP